MDDSIRNKKNKFQTKEMIDKIKNMSQEQGLNDREVSETLNCCRATITRIRKKYHIKKCNLQNKMDKYFVCCFCNKKIYVKRKELGRFMCLDCEEKIKKGQMTIADVNKMLQNCKNK